MCLKYMLNSRYVTWFALSFSLAFLIPIRAISYVCVCPKTKRVCIFGIHAVLLASLLAVSSILRL